MSGKSKYDCFGRFKKFKEEEIDTIEKIRQNRFKKGCEPGVESGFVGLALSGGGIRSAAFGLGVLHALHNQKLLRHIDYLSTVSGGGYIGSALTYFSAKHAKPGSDGVGDLLGTAFVGAKSLVSTQSDKSDSADEQSGNNKEHDNCRLDHIRRHGNYLTQGDQLGTGSAIAMVLRSCLVGIAIWLPIIALTLALLAVLAIPLESGHRAVFDRETTTEIEAASGTDQLAQVAGESVERYSVGSIAARLDLASEGPAEVTISADLSTARVLEPLTIGETLVYVAWLALFCIVCLGLYAIFRCLKGDKRPVEASYEDRLRQQRWMGRLLRAAIFFLVVASLPKALHALQFFGASLAESSFVAVLGSVLGGVTAFQAFHRSIGKGGESAVDFGGILAAAGAALLLYAGLLLALLFANGIMATAVSWLSEGEAVYAGWGVLVAFALGSLVVAYRTDLNLIALHRFYRDRLMETFMPDPDKAGRWHPAEVAERFWLADACPATSSGPYQLINTNVVLARSKDTGYAGRGGDSFVLSPLYCGSDATDWCPTKDWIKLPAEGNSDTKEAGASAQTVEIEQNPTKESAFDHLSLATAMAISGAAVNPHAGSSGSGPTRNRLVSMAMSALNLRLGYWVPNPNRKDQTTNRKGFTHKPTWLRIFACMLLPGSAGKGARVHAETAPLVELTDGGHFENLGLYELVRRKVKLIVVADAGCDPRFGYADLGNAIERCRVDFGVSIRFEDEAFDLRHLAPLPSDEPLQRVFPLAKRGVAVGRIRYPGKHPNDDPEIGHLIYIKTTLTEHLPADVYAYKQANPLFPDQSTGDQFFDEVQFEAYRELGYSLFENFVDEFGKTVPERTAKPLPSDRFRYDVLIDWLHGRGRWAVGEGVSPSVAA